MMRPARPSERARGAAFAAQAPHESVLLAAPAAGGRIRWCAHALRTLDGRGETVFAIAADGRVLRVLSDGTEVPVVGAGYRPLHSPPLRTAADARALLARIREAEAS